jgi:HK97 family phage major capsid protein
MATGMTSVSLLNSGRTITSAATTLAVNRIDGNASAPLVPLVTQQSDGNLYMLSKRILFTEKLPILGSQGDILLADFSQYAIGMRQGTALEQSQHAGFTTDQTYFRVITRVDGQGTWKTSVKPKNGSNLSWCVTLATRP